MDSHSSLEMYWKRVFEFRIKPKNPFCELNLYISLSKCKCNLAKMIIVSTIYICICMYRYICKYIYIDTDTDVIALFGGIYGQCVSEFFNALRLLVLQLFGLTSDQFAGITYSKSMPDGNMSIYSRLDNCIINSWHLLTYCIYTQVWFPLQTLMKYA